MNINAHRVQPILSLVVWLGVVVSPNNLWAQTTPSNPTDLAAADAAWQAIKNLGRPAAPQVRPAGKTPKPTKAENAAKFLDEADRFKAFYTNYPAHVSAKEAKQREVIALAFAALNGDAAHEDRRQSSLADIRKDAALSARERCEAVAWSSRVGLQRQARNPAGVLGDEEALSAPSAQFVGICLDTNTEVARQAAAAKNAPGSQYYDAKGRESPLAEALCLRESMTVLLIDGTGIIRDIQGSKDFRAKIAGLAK